MNAVDTLPAVPRSDHVAKLLRLPRPLSERIEEEARRGYRPYTAQVIMMLEQWLEQNAPSTPTNAKKGK